MNVARLIGAAAIVALVPSLAVAAPAHKTAKDGHYVGTASVYPVRFDIASKGSKATNVVIAYDATCEGAPGDTPPKFHFGTLSIKDGEFSGDDTKTFGPGDHQEVSFHAEVATRDSVTGMVKSTLHIKSLGSCTEKEPLTAKLQ